MKCEMVCTKKAKLKISISNGEVQHLCFRHSFMFLKLKLQGLARWDYGIYVQRVPEPGPPWSPSSEARHAVTLPEDRARKKEVLSVFKSDDDDWSDL